MQACFYCEHVEFNKDRTEFRCGNLLLDEALSAGVHGDKGRGRIILAEQRQSLPHCHRVAFNYGWYAMAEGDLQRGLALMDRGRFEGVFGSPPLAAGTPIWHPSIPLQGKTVLLRGEGGLGDEIINVRFAADLKKLGASRVLIASQPSLSSLFSRLQMVDAIVHHTQAAFTHHDYWLPAMSAARLVGHTHATLWSGPYLTASPEKIKEWAWLGRETGFKIGFKWSGNPGFEHQQHRRFDPKLMLSLADISGIRGFALQRDDDRLVLPSKITDLGDKLDTWEETAAIIHHLDLVVTSCTSVAHLAAAMGKPAWVLVPVLPYYVWATPGRSSPWYGSHVRLFRQRQQGNWSSAFMEIRTKLYEIVGRGGLSFAA